MNFPENYYRKLKKTAFSAGEAIAIKNSFFQILTNVTAKLGSLIFTIILARILLPEAFGLYSLALSAILIFAALSDFGINQTMTRFISREEGKNKEAIAKSYFFYLAKIKIILIIASIITILLTAEFISDYYQKPIFLAIMVGSFYVLFSGLFVILKSAFEAINNFKVIFYQEIIFQISRIFFIPLIAIFSLNLAIEGGVIVAYVIGGLSLSYLFSLFFLFYKSKKINFLKKKKKELSKRQKSSLNRFIIAISATIFSGIFFSHIDKIMLGYFVDASFIGYYSAAFTIIFASTQLFTFSSALLPVFSRGNIKNLDLLYKKAKKIVFFLSLVSFIFFFAFSTIIVKILFGSEYLASANILRLFSVLLVFLPIISLSTTFLIAKGKPEAVSKIIIASTIVNVFLNYILISKMVVFGQIFGVYGAIIATIISHLFYFGLLMAHHPRKI